MKRICASSWTFTKNHCMMHGQQNVKLRICNTATWVTLTRLHITFVDCVWNVMAHAHKPDFFFRWKGWVHLNRLRRQFKSTTGSRGVRISGSNAGYTMFRGSVKSTGYPLHLAVSPSLPSRASSCAITFQLDSTYIARLLCKSKLSSFHIVLSISGEGYGATKHIIGGSYTKHPRAIGALKME